MSLFGALKIRIYFQSRRIAYTLPTPVRQNFFILIGTLFFSALSFGQGGPPLITDDPDPPGNGHWEINIALTLNAVTEAQTFELPHFDVNYGLGDSIQLKWESGIALVTQTGSPALAGWEDSLFGVKWRILNGGEQGISLGTYPQFGVRLFSSNNPDIAGPRYYALLPVELKKGWGNFAISAEVGAVLSADAPNGWMYGVCGGYNVTQRIELLAEVHGQVSGTAGASLLFPPGLIVQIGASLGFNDHLAAILSMGRALLIPDGEDATTLFFAGVKLTL
jgi:hypothetical protein